MTTPTKTTRKSFSTTPKLSICFEVTTISSTSRPFRDVLWHAWNVFIKCPSEREINQSFSFWSLQVSRNLVAFEDADIKEACKSDDLWDMVDSFEYNNPLGDVLSAGADDARNTRHWNLLRGLAGWGERHALLLNCQSSRLLLNSHDNDLNLLHADLDKGNWGAAWVERVLY